jgi:hypothetical protein
MQMVAKIQIKKRKTAISVVFNKHYKGLAKWIQDFENIYGLGQSFG